AQDGMLKFDRAEAVAGPLSRPIKSLLYRGASIMKTAAEYRKHAEECRVLAKQVPEGEHRNQLLEMARTWDNLAKDRERLVRNHPELDTSKNPTKAHVPSK
ncbi:hypothetical protein, partial [Microvirga zambiensis]|uniref:hypothetical protein n=1 Tax=Microvirga zambiensis TaxID=1402137 RepID=UPI001AEF37CA